ncbi:MAG: radical SAM protein [Anaerolineae bacterium]|nr:radical SAM protein [Anaerolineae bacterium]
MTHEPSYVLLYKAGELEQRVNQCNELLNHCSVCPLECKVNRLAGEIGFCKSAALARVSSYGPHHGEEQPLSGWNGSGTIFFTHCNLRCQYCQNYDISQTNNGMEVSAQELANIMLKLQNMGCHNINFVSPTHIVPQILSALLIAVQAGLRLPLVYNSGGYDSVKTLQLLEGIFDIYMPDMKYADEQTARRYSKIPNYPHINQAAIREMYRQVGDLVIDEDGIAQRGLLVRHLVLPNNLAGSRQIFEFLAQEVSKNTYLNVMAQYHPAYYAHHYPELNRGITTTEYQNAIQIAQSVGLTRLDKYNSWSR